MNINANELEKVQKMLNAYSEQFGEVKIMHDATNCRMSCSGTCSGGCNNFCTSTCSGRCDGSSTGSCWNSR